MKLQRRFVDVSSNNATPQTGPVAVTRKGRVIGPAAGLNWAKYAQAGHVFAVVKLTEGETYIDPYWHEWVRACHTNGIAVGHYHFAKGPGAAEGFRQAHRFLSQLAESNAYRPQHDRIILDIEGGSELKDPVGYVHAFESVCLARGHDSLIVYSDSGSLAAWGERVEPRSGKLWIAAYPSLPRGWWPRHPWAHQDTDTAEIPGIGRADSSYMKATAFAWLCLHRPRRITG